MEELKHKDTMLNILRWAAFGAMGLYLWQVKRKEGNLSGASNEGKDFQVNLNTDKVVDCIMPLIPVKDLHKPMLNAGLKEFLNGFKEKL